MERIGVIWVEREGNGTHERKSAQSPKWFAPNAHFSVTVPPAFHCTQIQRGTACGACGRNLANAEAECIRQPVGSAQNSTTQESLKPPTPDKIEAPRLRTGTSGFFVAHRQTKFSLPSPGTCRSAHIFCVRSQAPARTLLENHRIVLVASATTRDGENQPPVCIA